MTKTPSIINDSFEKIKGYKIICESNIVALLWKHPELLYSYKFQLEDFVENMWRVCYTIAQGIVISEDKKLDDITTSFYLEKHPKLAEKFNEYGGYEKIIDTGEFVDKKNFESYVKENQKWKVVIELLKLKYPVYDRISDFVDMSIDDIYDEFNARLNHVFANAEGDVQSHGLGDGLEELIDEYDQGASIGLYYYDMKMLNKETSGRLLGNLDMVGAVSNVGKSTIARNLCIPMAIQNKEPLCIIVNEEDERRVKMEAIVFVANNILGKDMTKYTVRDGKYTPEAKEILLESAKWLVDNNASELVRIVPFSSYTTSLAMKIISKYASLGYKYFVLDTLKLDSDMHSELFWLNLQQNAVKLFDLIKPKGLNVHLLITYQLGKASVKQRYLTQDSLGNSKSVIDVCATAILVRNLQDNEYTGMSKEVKVYRLEGRNGRTKIPVALDDNKKYQIFFIAKNRQGSANAYQIVAEVDYSTNKIKEIGICNILPDF